MASYMAARSAGVSPGSRASVITRPFTHSMMKKGVPTTSGSSHSA